MLSSLFPPGLSLTTCIQLDFELPFDITFFHPYPTCTFSSPRAYMQPQYIKEFKVKLNQNIWETGMRKQKD